MPKARKPEQNADLSDTPRGFSSTFGDRLTILLDMFESRAEAADVAGVGPNQLARYVRGDADPAFETMARLCRRKNVSMEWLFNGEGKMADREKPFDGAVMVPLYDVRAGAGAAKLANNEEPATLVGIDPGFLASLGVKPENAALMIADGESMEDTIRHGESVLYDRSETQPRDAIFIMRREGGVLVKRLQRRADGSLMLISDNPAFQPEVLPRDEIEDIHLIGRVKFVFRRL